MPTSLKRRCWILLPALVLYCLDISLTLIGQPADYWAGDWAKTSEINPIAYPLLAAGAICFAVAAVLWAAAFSTFILLARLSIARIVAYVIAFGHAIGAATWLVRHGVMGWIAAVALLVAAAWFTSYCSNRTVCRL
jgi:hypothetical protein